MGANLEPTTEIHPEEVRVYNTDSSYHMTQLFSFHIPITKLQCPWGYRVILLQLPWHPGCFFVSWGVLEGVHLLCFFPKGTQVTSQHPKAMPKLAPVLVPVPVQYPKSFPITSPKTFSNSSPRPRVCFYPSPSPRDLPSPCPSPQNLSQILPQSLLLSLWIEGTTQNRPLEDFCSPFHVPAPSCPPTIHPPGGTLRTHRPGNTRVSSWKRCRRWPEEGGLGHDPKPDK